MKNSLLVQDTRVHLIHDQFFEKLATRLDVAQTEAQAEATKVSLIQAETDVQNARATLAFLIGQKEVKSPLVDDFAPPTPKPESDYMTDALKTRRDLLAPQFNINSARRAVDVYIAEYYPSVSLNVAGFLYREYFSEASKWDAVLSANLPIFSAGLIEADVRAAWSRLRQAALAELNTRRSVMHDVQIAYANLISSAPDQRIRGRSRRRRRSLSPGAKRFQNGLAINLDVLSAQDQLLNAELELTGVRPTTASSSTSTFAESAAISIPTNRLTRDRFPHLRQHNPSNKTRIRIRCQKHIRRRNLLRLGRPLKQCLAPNCFTFLAG